MFVNCSPTVTRRAHRQAAPFSSLPGNPDHHPHPAVQYTIALAFLPFLETIGSKTDIGEQRENAKKCLHSI
jgi:hypothetical protein